MFVGLAFSPLSLVSSRALSVRCPGHSFSHGKSLALSLWCPPPSPPILLFSLSRLLDLLLYLFSCFLCFLFPFLEVFPSITFLLSKAPCPLPSTFLFLLPLFYNSFLFCVNQIQFLFQGRLFYLFEILMIVIGFASFHCLLICLFPLILVSVFMLKAFLSY